MKEPPTIFIPAAVWAQTWEGLKAFSAGRRESACIWAGLRNHNRQTVQQVHFLDALPGVHSHRRFHLTSREATSVLFEKLRAAGQSIIADVHTHPTDWVDLSATDAAHPIEYRVGLFALVLPSFATDHPDLARTGVHIYLGDGKWNQLSSEEAHRRIQIT